MKLYVADYFGDAHDLNVVEHGTYFLLLAALWRSNGAIAATDENLSSKARCTPEQWAAVKARVLPFFKVVRGKLTHARVTKELSKYEDIIGKRKRAGKSGGTSSRGNVGEIPQANAKQTPPYPEPEPEPLLTEEKSSVRATKRGSRISPDWEPGEIGVAYAKRLGFEAAAIDRMSEKFKNYWGAKTGSAATKIDWTATWRNWALTESERLPKAGPKQVDWC